MRPLVPLYGGGGPPGWVDGGGEGVGGGTWGGGVDSSSSSSSLDILCSLDILTSYQLEGWTQYVTVLYHLPHSSYASVSLSLIIRLNHRD